MLAVPVRDVALLFMRKRVSILATDAGGGKVHSRILERIHHFVGSPIFETQSAYTFVAFAVHLWLFYKEVIPRYFPVSRTDLRTVTFCMRIVFSGGMCLFVLYTCSASYLSMLCPPPAFSACDRIGALKDG